MIQLIDFKRIADVVNEGRKIAGAHPQRRMKRAALDGVGEALALCPVMAV